MIKYIVLTILLSVAWLYYLTRPIKIKKYQCKYAVVTGATGGTGSELVSQLVENMNVIIIARNQVEIEKLITKYEGKVIGFKFDFSEDLKTFADRFTQFMNDNNIKREDIGLCFSNAGYGEYRAFHATSFEHKKAFMQVNLDSHICVADFFIKIFTERSKQKKRSGLVFTSSVAAHAPGRYFSLYHTAKNAISSLGNALYAEYLFKKIDILVVHPGPVSNTKFFQNEGMRIDGKQIPMVSNMENSFMSVTPKQVVNRMLTRLGKENVVQVGWVAVCGALMGVLGRNFNGFVWSLFSLNKKLVE
uniref:Reductase n=1 Tax=Trepomonas sp. PC1 TaxID=1076344 RepID=A0A146KHK5_9EUKA|eukprot:JAP95947.1 Reductase [Trepomonas sp. PC1]